MAMMLTRQPLFVGGIEDLPLARSNAWAGLVVYLSAFATAMVFVAFDACRSPAQRNAQTRRRSGNEYDGIPTGTGPPVIEQYAMSLDLPESITDRSTFMKMIYL